MNTTDIDEEWLSQKTLLKTLCWRYMYRVDSRVPDTLHDDVENVKRVEM